MLFQRENFSFLQIWYAFWSPGGTGLTSQLMSDIYLERLQLRNNQDILCMEGVGGKVKRDAKFFGVACAENGV